MLTETCKIKDCFSLDVNLSCFQSKQDCSMQWKNVSVVKKTLRIRAAGKISISWKIKHNHICLETDIEQLDCDLVIKFHDLRLSGLLWVTPGKSLVFHNMDLINNTLISQSQTFTEIKYSQV